MEMTSYRSLGRAAGSAAALAESYAEDAYEKANSEPLAYEYATKYTQPWLHAIANVYPYIYEPQASVRKC